MKQIPTLYQWAGGIDTFELLFAKFYEKVSQDEILQAVFSTMSKEHVQHVAHFVAEVFGGKDPEFRSALVGYLEWGTRIAVINSALAENPMVAAEPMPKWGWGETGGPYQPDGA